MRKAAGDNVKSSIENYVILLRSLTSLAILVSSDYNTGDVKYVPDCPLAPWEQAVSVQWKERWKEEANNL